jgi:dTDP-4-dehydrorhamnose reductase
LSFFGTLNPVYCYSSHPVGQERFLELTEPKNFNFNNIHAGDYVIFLAAVSSPDICEKQFNYAYRTNVIGTKEYIRRFIYQGAHVLFFSSDAVLGATEGPCNEHSICNPFGVYGKMKREVEEIFNNFSNFKVFRLSYVFSAEDKFTSYLNQCNKERKIAEVYDALYRNVIYLYDILEAIKILGYRFNDFKNTIFHLSGPDLLSRKDIAEYYKKIISPEFQYRLVSPPNNFFNARPNIIETKSLYLFSLMGRTLIPIYDALSLEYNSNKQ